MLPGASRRATWLRWFHLRTVPSRKGQGLGGALLRKACADADAARVPAYLETANPVNLGLYRRFGFEVDGEIRIGDAPTVWTMTRPPG